MAIIEAHPQPSLEFEIKELIAAIIGHEIINIELDTDLFESKVLDSLSAVRLILKLEERYNFFFDDQQLELSGLKSINELAATIRKVTESDQPSNTE